MVLADDPRSSKRSGFPGSRALRDSTARWPDARGAQNAGSRGLQIEDEGKRLVNGLLLGGGQPTRELVEALDVDRP